MVMSTLHERRGLQIRIVIYTGTKFASMAQVQVEVSSWDSHVPNLPGREMWPQYGNVV